MNDKVLSNDPVWAEVLCRLVQSEKALHRLSYKEISRRLEHIGTIQSPATLKSKFSRGNFGAQLLLQLMLVMNCQTLNTEHIKQILDTVKTEKNSLLSLNR